MSQQTDDNVEYYGRTIEYNEWLQAPQPSYTGVINVHFKEDPQGNHLYFTGIDSVELEHVSGKTSIN